MILNMWVEWIILGGHQGVNLALECLGTWVLAVENMAGNMVGKYWMDGWMRLDEIDDWMGSRLKMMG